MRSKLPLLDIRGISYRTRRSGAVGRSRGRRRFSQRKVNLKRLWLVLLSVGSSNALAEIVWKGNFDTGDRSHGGGADRVRSARLQFVDSPVKGGRSALKALGKKYENPTPARGNQTDFF